MKEGRKTESSACEESDHIGCTHARSGYFLEGREEQTEVHSCTWNEQTGRPEASLSVARLSPTNVDNK